MQKLPSTKPLQQPQIKLQRKDIDLSRTAVAKLVEEVTSTVEPKASKPAAMDSYVNAPVNVTTKKQAPVLKNRVFAGSVEWTDKKIAEYQSHLTENRTPGIDNANSASQQKSDNPRFKQPQMVNYETFESSSDPDENEPRLFESEYLSFTNKNKLPTSQEKELKRAERQKRKYRKINDKVKAVKLDERLKKRNLKQL